MVTDLSNVWNNYYESMGPGSLRRKDIQCTYVLPLSAWLQCWVFMQVRRYVRYSAAQSSTVQYSTVQYSRIQYRTVQCGAVQYSTVQQYISTVQHSSTVQYSTVHQYSTVQYSTVRCTWSQTYLYVLACYDDILCYDMLYYGLWHCIMLLFIVAQ